MKRYQCIKNVFYPKADPATGRMIPTLSFKAGSVYPEHENVKVGKLGPVSWPYLIDDHGKHHVTTPELLENFQELLDLHVDEHEEEQYTAMLPKKNRLSTGCAILILFILTVLALIFFR